MLGIDDIKYLSITNLRRLASKHREVSDGKLRTCLAGLDLIFSQGEMEIQRYLERKARKKGSCHGECCGNDDNW